MFNKSLADILATSRGLYFNITIDPLFRNPVLASHCDDHAIITKYLKIPLSTKISDDVIQDGRRACALHDAQATPVLLAFTKDEQCHKLAQILTLCWTVKSFPEDNLFLDVKVGVHENFNILHFFTENKNIITN